MTLKFRGKYRIASLRLKNWDYASNGIYFVTINTKNRKNFFGEITDSKMILSPAGKICNACLIAIPEHFEFVKLPYFVVMPNHLHAILIIKQCGSEKKKSILLRIPKVPEKVNMEMSVIAPKAGSLSVIVRSLKSAVSKQAHVINPKFQWQPGFYERIVRDHQAYLNIANYIEANIKKWKGK